LKFKQACYIVTVISIDLALLSNLLYFFSISLYRKYGKAV
jgi:uncharacterized membrane protein YqhA